MVGRQQEYQARTRTRTSAIAFDQGVRAHQQVSSLIDPTTTSTTSAITSSQIIVNHLLLNRKPSNMSLARQHCLLRQDSPPRYGQIPRPPRWWLLCQVALLFLLLQFAHSQPPNPKPNQQQQLSLNQTQRLSKRQVLQRFLVEPESLTVNIGETVTLPCRVSNKAGQLQWTRDGFGLGTDPRLEGFPSYSMMQNEATGDYSLKISSVTLEDDATFQCQIGASESVPGIRSQSARLKVQVPPSEPVIVTGNYVNAHPSAQNQQVLSTTAGTTIELTCEAHGGRPAAELSWLNGRSSRVVKKGLSSSVKAMNDGKRSNAALKWTFEPTKADHHKKLSCRSTHPTLANGSLASIVLEVKYAPEVRLEVSRLVATSSASALTAMGSSLHGRIGDTLRVKCIADGNPGKDSLIYTWFKGSEEMPGDAREELILRDVDKTWNDVDIKCQVANTVGVGKATVTLNIAYGPSFLPSMELVHGATSGETVRLGCNVDSNPTAEITWIKIGSSSVMSSGSKLPLRNVNEDNVGEYLCRASVKGFSEISAIVYLRLNGPPKIRKRKSHNYAVLGESGHVDCLVESVPSPIAITWVHNGQVFTSTSASSHPGNVHVAEEKLREEANIIRASFDIKVTAANDYGYYNCVVVNKYGSDWQLVSLQEQTSFSTIVTITSISISGLVFVVLSTIICLLWSNHRKLVRQQRQSQESENLKKHYMSQSDESDNHNIYSTASTRTNSTSAEKTGTGETGTIITRSGSTGSPRSSTSSFPPYLESSSHHSPAPSQSNYGNQLQQQQQQQQPHSHTHAHHQQQHHHHHLPPPHPPHLHSVFESVHSPFFGAFEHSSMEHPHSLTTYHSSTSPLGNGHHDVFSTAAPPNGSFASLSRASLGASLAPYSLMPLYGQHQPQPLYQANPYAVRSQVKSHPSSSTLPTPPPSLTRELDNCTKSSIATHV